MATSRPSNSYAFRFAVDALVLLLVTKAAFAFTGALGDPLLPTLASYFQDGALVLLGAGLLVLVERPLPRRAGPLLRALFVAWAALITLASLAYTPLLPNILEQPVNLFALDPSLIAFSAQIFFTPLVWTGAATVLILLFGLPLVFPRRLNPASRVVKAAVLVHGLLLAVSLLGPPVSPLLYSLFDEGASLGRRYLYSPYGIGRLEPSAAAGGDADCGALFRGVGEAVPSNPRYDRVVVLVMESVDYDAFTAHFEGPGAGFLGKIRGHAILYSNYHCLNLESYTGLMTLLNGVFIPYRAYGDDAPFRFVGGRDNLVRQLRASGFAAWFVSSYGAWQVRFVPDVPDWDGILLKDPAKSPGFIAVNTTAIERALEDRAVLDDVLALCRRPGRLFLFQEMVAGHAPVWTERTGIPPLVYYDRYFDELYDRLEREGLMDRTLLVITSDHGPRPAPLDPASYHLPLLLVAPDLTGGTDDAFLSHLDFGAVVKARLGGKSVVPARDRLFTVGSSVDFTYGMLARDGNYAFIDDHSLRVSTDMPASAIRPFQRAFEGYLGFFDAQRRASPPGPDPADTGNLVVK